MKRCSSFPLRGQTLVEFALMLPIFILLVVVIFDLGRAVYYLSSIHNAAREGARYGIIHPDDSSGIQDSAINYAIGVGITLDDVTSNVSLSDQVDENITYQVSVIVNFCFIPATPLVEIFIPESVECDNEQQINLVGEAIMRTEAKPSN